MTFLKNASTNFRRWQSTGERFPSPSQLGAGLPLVEWLVKWGLPPARWGDVKVKLADSESFPPPRSLTAWSAVALTRQSSARSSQEDVGSVIARQFGGGQGMDA